MECAQHGSAQAFAAHRARDRYIDDVQRARHLGNCQPTGRRAVSFYDREKRIRVLSRIPCLLGQELLEQHLRADWLGQQGEVRPGAGKKREAEYLVGAGLSAQSQKAERRMYVEAEEIFELHGTRLSWIVANGDDVL